MRRVGYWAGWMAAAVMIQGALGQVGVAQPPVRFDGQSVVRVWPEDMRELRTVLALTEDVWTCGFGGSGETLPEVAGGVIDMRVAPEALETLKGTGIGFRVLIPDVQKLIDQERQDVRPPMQPRGPGAPAFFDDYRDYATVSAYVNTLVGLRPDLASRVSVGQSTLNSEIFGIRINAPGAAPGSKPAFIVQSCQHAREWVTVMSGMWFADRLIRNYDTDAEARRILDNFEVIVIPIANPDGYQFTHTTNRLWRKNRRTNADGSIGVDMNRNWGYLWGGPGASATPSDETYRGASAFSEIETQALRDFVFARPNTAVYFDVHSYSQLILEPYGGTNVLPAGTRGFAAMSAAIQQAMYAPQQQDYLSGEIYRAIYPASGGSIDWTFGARGALGVSFELRDRGQYGFILPVNQLLPASIECEMGLRASANWAIDNRVYVHFVSERPTRISPGDPAVRVQLTRGISVPADPTTNTPQVFARIGRTGSFTAVPVTNIGSDEGGVVFSHSLPVGACGSVTQWYYSVQLADGSSVTVPSAGAYEATARTSTIVFSDDFETNQNWIVGDTTAGSADNATTGIWTRVDPQGTTAQPEYDVTPLAGALCFITGQNPRGNAGNGDVDSGKTTLQSPVINLAGAMGTELSFWWWANTARAGEAYIDVTANATAGTPAWTRVYTVSSTAPTGEVLGRWTRRTIRLSDFVAPSASTRVRIVVRDVNGVTVEGAIDDVVVRTITCERGPCAADFNADGATTVADIFDYLNAWFAGEPAADVDGGGLTVQDIFTFLNTWFAGCP